MVSEVSHGERSSTASGVVRRLARAAVVSALSLAALACSADAVEPPEPQLTTPGAFVAFEPEEGDLYLFQTVLAVRLEGTTFLRVAIFEARPTSYDEARELARDPNLDVADPAAGLNLASFDRPHRVVWFRSLDQERE